MKKLLVAVIMLAMLVQLGAGMLVGADDAATYKLVTHWDFEGDDVYADKATAGTTSDKLNTEVGNVTIENGVATILDSSGQLSNGAADGTAGNGTSSYISADAAEGSDLYSFKNKTVIIKAKIYKSEWVSGIFGKDNAFAYGVANKGTHAIAYYNNNVAITGEEDIAPDYRVYAMTLTYNEATELTTISLYMSKVENPTTEEDFILMAATEQKIDKIDSTNAIFIGKRGAGHKDAVRNLDLWVDDIKIFDGVLTLAEMATESPVTSLNESLGTDTEPSDTEPVETEPIVPVTPIGPGGNTNTGTDTKDTADTEKNNDAAQTDNDVTDTNATDTDAEEEKKGCGSYMSMGVVGIAACAMACAISKKKRK